MYPHLHISVRAHMRRLPVCGGRQSQALKVSFKALYHDPATPSSDHYRTKTNSVVGWGVEFDTITNLNEIACDEQ